jgi:hypothetical protein
MFTIARFGGRFLFADQKTWAAKADASGNIEILKL